MGRPSAYGRDRFFIYLCEGATDAAQDHDIQKLETLAPKLNQPPKDDVVSTYLHGKLSPETLKALADYKGGSNAVVAQVLADVGFGFVDDAGDIAGIVTVDDAMEFLLPKDWRQRLPRVFG